MSLFRLFSPIISWIQESLSNTTTDYAIQGTSGGALQSFNDENDTFNNIKEITDIDFNESEVKLTETKLNDENNETTAKIKDNDYIENLDDDADSNDHLEIIDRSCDERFLMEEPEENEEDDFVSIGSEEEGQISPYGNNQGSIFDMYKRSSVINKQLSGFNTQFSPAPRKYTLTIRKPLVTKEEIRALTKFYKEVNPNYTPTERKKINPRSEEERQAVAETLRFVEWYKSKFS